MSEWFNEDPEIQEQEMVPVKERWICPQAGCDGEMKYNGFSWPTGTPGYHHTCDKCGYTAAMRGKQYPRITYKPKG